MALVSAARSVFEFRSRWRWGVGRGADMSAAS